MCLTMNYMPINPSIHQYTFPYALRLRIHYTYYTFHFTWCKTSKGVLVSDIKGRNMYNRPFYSCALSYMNAKEAGGGLALIQTSLLFSLKCKLVSIRTSWFTQQTQWRLYQTKVICSLAVIQRPGHWTDNCKMVYCTSRHMFMWISINWRNWQRPSPNLSALSLTPFFCRTASLESAMYLGMNFV